MGTPAGITAAAIGTTAGTMIATGTVTNTSTL
jgi:hypothetical protein